LYIHVVMLYTQQDLNYRLIKEERNINVYLLIEGGSSRSHYVEESFWKRLWTCHLTDDNDK